MYIWSLNKLCLLYICLHHFSEDKNGRKWTNLASYKQDTTVMLWLLMWNISKLSSQRFLSSQTCEKSIHDVDSRRDCKHVLGWCYTSCTIHLKCSSLLGLQEGFNVNAVRLWAHIWLHVKSGHSYVLLLKGSNIEEANSAVWVHVCFDTFNSLKLSEMLFCLLNVFASRHLKSCELKCTEKNEDLQWEIIFYFTRPWLRKIPLNLRKKPTKADGIIEMGDEFCAELVKTEKELISEKSLKDD